MPQINLSDFVGKVKGSLVPFVFSLIIYTLFCVPMEHQTIFGMIIKCLPILTLQYFTCKHGVGLKGDEQTFQRKILLALGFACVGDAFLDFPNYFLHGTVSFAIAQMLNISAFGFSPLNLGLGAKLFAVLSIPLIVIMPKLQEEEKILLIVISCYAPLLKIMIWRAVARATSGSERDWSKIFCAAGAISFGLSDATLALNRYYKPVPYAQAIIMATYYMAQCGIALSVVSTTTTATATKKSKKSK